MYVITEFIKVEVERSLDDPDVEVDNDDVDDEQEKLIGFGWNIRDFVMKYLVVDNAAF